MDKRIETRVATCNKKRSFWIFFILFQLFFLSFYFIESLRKAYGDNALKLSDNRLYFILTTALLLITAGYILAFKFFDRNIITASNKKILACFVFLNLSLLFVWPVSSNDIFSYIYQNRVLSHYGKNPYIVPYSSISNDPFYDLIGNDWSNKTSPYGPLFVSVGAMLSNFTGNNIFLTLFLYKVLFITANTGVLYLLIKIFKNPNLSFLYAFNPLLIFEFAINGHNDVLVIFLLIFSLFFCFKKNASKKDHLACIFLFTLGVMIKSIILIFAPFLGLFILSRYKDFKDVAKVTAGGLIVFLGTVFVFYFPFWEGLEIFDRLSSQINQTLGIFYSLGILLTSFMLMGEILLEENSIMLATKICRLSFVAIYIFMIYRFYKYINSKKGNRADENKKYLAGGIFLIITLFLFLFPTWLMPWYYCYLIVLGLMAWHFFNKVYILNIIFGITLFAFSYYFILR